jgi:hypothetical protein
MWVEGVRVVLADGMSSLNSKEGTKLNLENMPDIFP